jgi:hypothetical protein
MPLAPIELLRQWLTRTLPEAASRWLETEISRQSETIDERRLGMALGLVGRRIGRAAMVVPAEDAAALQDYPGWQPEKWSSDEAARVALLLAAWHNDERAFVARVERLCRTGELNERIACLKGFAVFPIPALLLGCARDAARSSLQPQFEAIACCNPYPAAQFDSAAFNQMVVKCVFSGVAIETVVGLQERRNPELVRMLVDLVSERKIAGRSVPDSVHRYLADNVPLE